MFYHAPWHWPLSHVTSSVTWLFDWPWAICYRCSIGTDTMSKVFRGIEAQMYLGHAYDLSKSRDVIGHVTVGFPWATSYRCSIGTDTLSPRNFEILRLKCIWVTVLTFLGHVTSSVTWSFFPRYVVSYRWSVDTSFVTDTVTEIFWLQRSYQCCVKPGLHFPCVNGHVAHCACAVSRDLVVGGQK